VKWTFVVACACVWLFASRGGAQLATLREHTRQMDSGNFALSLDVSSFFGSLEGARHSFVQPTALASLRAGEAVFEAAVPFAYLHQRPADGPRQNRFSSGNPWFAIAYLPDTSCGLARLSLGVAAPVASGSTPLRRRALELARAVQGGWDSYLFMERMLPLVFGAGTLKDISVLRLAWDADLIVGLPGGRRDVEFGAQTAGELALRLVWHTSAAARATVAYHPTLGGDELQTALAFVLRHARPQGDSFGARFVLNLDRFSFARDGVWGAGVFYATSL
jgi:hypothetical protein